MNMFIYRKKIYEYENYIVYLRHECNSDRRSQRVRHPVVPESHTYVSFLLQENQRNILLLHKMVSAYKLLSAIRIKRIFKKKEIIVTLLLETE